MKTAVITPTYRYGGLREEFFCLSNQTVLPDYWIIADDLFRQRESIVEEHTLNAPFTVIHFEPKPKPEGYYSNIGSIYNEMLAIVDQLGVDLIISLQDWFWIEPNGIERWIKTYELFPGQMLTALADIALEPAWSTVDDPLSPWSLWSGPIPPPPTGLWWSDVREAYYNTEYAMNNAVEWELNWAAWPARFSREGVKFDEEYGKGLSLENQDYALQCNRKFGAGYIIDMENKAVGYPHKLYWPEQAEARERANPINEKYHEAKWKGAII